jgi:hypothetical protein
MRFLLLALVLLTVETPLLAVTGEEHHVIYSGGSLRNYDISPAGREALKTFDSYCLSGHQTEAIAWLNELAPAWTSNGLNDDFGLLLSASRFKGPQHRPVLRALIGRMLAIPPTSWDVPQDWIDHQFQDVKSNLLWNWDHHFAELTREERRDHAQADVRLLLPWLKDILKDNLTSEELRSRFNDREWQVPELPSGLNPYNPDRNDPRYPAWRDAVLKIHRVRGPAFHRAEAWERLSPELLPIFRLGWPRLEGGRAALTAELVKATYPKSTIDVVIAAVYGETAP